MSSSLTFPSLHHCPHAIVCISLHPLLFLITSLSSCHSHHLTLLTSPSTRHHRLTRFMSPSSCHPSHVTLFTSPSNDLPSVLTASFSHFSCQCLHVIFLTSMFLCQFTLLTIPFICHPPHVRLLTSPSSSHPLGVTFLTHITILMSFPFISSLSSCVSPFLSSSSNHPTPLTSPSSLHPHSTLFHVTLLMSPSLSSKSIVYVNCKINFSP